MKSPKLLFLFIIFYLSGYTQINFDEFENFKSQHAALSYQGLNEFYPRPYDKYYKGFSGTPDFRNVLYFDSLRKKMALTTDEISLLEQNHFFVTERLSFNNFGQAVHEIYSEDLPLFISTDAILHALHCSYSYLLKNMERSLMANNLEVFLKDLYDRFPDYAIRYTGTGVDESLKDADLYVSIAYSLISGRKQPPRFASGSLYDELMQAIAGEKAGRVSLFCKETRSRDIDFSQFKVRGHYVYTEEDRMMGYRSLEPYFRAMMWLGRIEFFMTAPEPNPWEIPWDKEEIRRMNISATLLNGLIQESAGNNLFGQNETIINYLVGESDNMTPAELAGYQQAKGITGAVNLYDDLLYDDYYAGFSLDPGFQQKIMGNMYFVNPYASTADTLPVSFRVSGQRFIIDSYVLANVVYDRIIHQGKKIHRGLPDPLDALFALGNSDALYFLEEELEEYHYAPNLVNMRYLIDNKEQPYWEESLYNCWLGAVRQLNPADNDESMPFFRKTSAWHQQKMNTQLASWSQLRHDNLLYAKPSYTGMTGCSFPHVYVEPYPEFYASLANYAENAGAFFATLSVNDWDFQQVQRFFPVFATIMRKLEILAQKELNNEPFSNDENKWLQSFLFEGGGSGAPPYSGWYNQLFLNPDDIVKNDYPIVDLHTQPTDKYGNPVGYVLHAGTGKVNLGTVMAKAPGTNDYVAYTGPFFSYYENVTENFLRLTDQDWSEKVFNKQLPKRPEWTQAYLAGSEGTIPANFQELPHQYLITGIKKASVNQPVIYPNPVSGNLYIEGIDFRNISYRIFNLTGKQVCSGNTDGSRLVDVSALKSGIYLIKIEAGKLQGIQKFLKE